MTNTILTIEYKEYSENVIVNASNESEVKELVKTAVNYKIAIQGDFYFTPEIKVKSVKRTRKVYKSYSGNEIVTYKACVVVIKKGLSEFRFSLPKMETGECNIRIGKLDWYARAYTCEQLANLDIKAL